MICSVSKFLHQNLVISSCSNNKEFLLKVKGSHLTSDPKLALIRDWQNLSLQFVLSSNWLASHLPLPTTKGSPLSSQFPQTCVIYERQVNTHGKTIWSELLIASKAAEVMHNLNLEQTSNFPPANKAGRRLYQRTCQPIGIFHSLFCEESKQRQRISLGVLNKRKRRWKEPMHWKLIRDDFFTLLLTRRLPTAQFSYLLILLTLDMESPQKTVFPLKRISLQLYYDQQRHHVFLNYAETAST